MRKFAAMIYMLVMAALVLSLSGCGGSSSSSVSNNDVPRVAEVAVIESPAFEVGGEYKIVKGATLNNMSGAKYFVKDMASSESDKAAMNLGFSETLGSQTLVFIKMDNDKEDRVVFAYDPSGKDGNYKTAGSVSYSGGTQLKYTSLTIPSGFYSSINVETNSAKVITLNGTSAVMDGSTVPSNTYVWHADPDHADEYYTLGTDGTDELTEDEMLEKISALDGVYINRDVRYMTNSLDFTATVQDDDETEYAAYYSDSVREKVSADLGVSLGSAYSGPYIFATLPRANGMGGNPGGNTPPSGGPGGNNPAETPIIAASVTKNGASYNTQIASTMSLMTHSAEEAYSNPVLHITKAGVYELTGTWNGQIWIEVGKTSSDKVAVILNGVDVTCTVAPSLVFKKVYECGPSDESTVASLMKTDSGDVGEYVLANAGAIVLINDDTVNNFTGSNVYRMLKPEIKKDSVTKIDGTDVSQQKKRYKMDGAFYSFMSMAIGAAGTKANGTLNVYSTSYEGLDTEMHAVFEDGVLNVVASDDGMNFNEDDISVFTMTGGELTVVTPNGDGIDSNGWIAIMGGSLDITAAQDSNTLNAQAEGPLDADCGVYMADGVNYSHRAYSSTGGGDGGGTQPVNPPSGGDDNRPTPPIGSDDNRPTPPTGSDDNRPTPPTGSDDNRPTPPTGSDDNRPSDDPSSGDVTPTPTPEPSTDTGSDEPDIVTPPSTDDNSSETPSNTPSTDTGTDDTPMPNTPNTPSTPDVDPNAPDDNGQDNTTPNVPTTPTTPDNSGNTGYVVTPEVDVPAGWDTDTVTIESTAGTTLINMGSTRVLTDTHASEPRNIPQQSKVFKLTRQVNTFSGITTEN